MAQQLAQQNVPVSLCAAEGSELLRRAREANLATTPLRFSKHAYLNPLSHLNFRSFFQELRPQHLILNLPTDLKTAAWGAKQAGVPDVIYRRGSAIPIQAHPLNRWLFGNVVDRMIANSHKTKATILENDAGLFSAEKIEVIYNGLHLEPSPLPAPEPQRPLVLGNVGRMVEQKNQRLLVRLGAQLRTAGVEFQLKIAGDGKLFAELEALIREQHLEQHIQLCGFVEDIPHFLQGIDIFLLPSLWEGFGYVLVEAMACGKPVIAFNHSSNPEIVSPESGILVPSGAEPAFFDATLHLIQDKSLREQMGQAARQHVQQRFTLQAATHHLLRFLQTTVTL